MVYKVSLHDRVLQVTQSEGGHARQSINKARGSIKGLSSKSRYRLIRVLAQISRPDEAVFITLTYRSFTDDFKSWKRHLHNFRRILTAEFPQLAAVWRLEFQQRGAPHFHILAWVSREVSLSWLEARLTEVWTRVIVQRSKANIEHGVTVAAVSDFRRSAFYISVYQSKDSQDRTDIQTGREWGMWHKERLGLEPLETIDLSEREKMLLQRVLRRLYVSYMRGRPTKSVSRKGGNSYLRGLRRNQPFTNFLPYHQSHRLSMWVTGSEAYRPLLIDELTPTSQ